MIIERNDIMKADLKKNVKLLKIVKGQVEGLINMMENNSYCIDISTQVLATQAILKKVNTNILVAHLNGCLKESLNGEGDDVDEKIDEVVKIIERLGK